MVGQLYGQTVSASLSDLHNKVFRQVVGTPEGWNVICATLKASVAYLFLQRMVCSQLCLVASDCSKVLVFKLRQRKF